MASKGSNLFRLKCSTSVACLLLHLANTLAQSPPRVSSNVAEIHRVVSAGSVIQLPCPVEASDPSSLLFEWYKDRRPISTFAEVRFRVGSSGTLKIKGVLPEDMGHYVCRAVNGYGSVEVNATLIVLADDDDDDFSDVDHHKLGDTTDSEVPVESMKGVRAKAKLIHVTKLSQPVAHKPVGSSVRLKCVASGNPRPTIVWLKNGHPLQSDDASKRGRWTLNLQNLQVTDSGNYTCVVRNPLGTDNTSFIIEVVDRVRNKPEILGSHPVNTTVEIGSDAVLQCRVKSDDPPHIQWLKHVDPSEVGKDDRQRVTKLHDEFYHILKNTEVLERPDGTFLNKLLIPDTKLSDSGRYVCLSVNTIGYIHRSAFLTVLPRMSAPGLPEETPSFPLIVIIGVIAGTVALLGSLAVVLLHRRFRKASLQPAVGHRTPHQHPHQHMGQQQRGSSSSSHSHHHHPSHPPLLSQHHSHHSKTSSSSVGTVETNPVYMPPPDSVAVDAAGQCERTYASPQHFHTASRHHPTPYGYYC